MSEAPQLPRQVKIFVSEFYDLEHDFHQRAAIIAHDLGEKGYMVSSNYSIGRCGIEIVASKIDAKVVDGSPLRQGNIAPES